MTDKWVKLDEHTHRYKGKDFEATALHTSAIHPEQKGVLPRITAELPPVTHGWILLGDFPNSPIRDCADFPTPVMAKAYAETRFREYRSNMARTGMSPEEVRTEIVRIRLTNDVTYLLGRNEHIEAKAEKTNLQASCRQAKRPGTPEPARQHKVALRGYQA